MVTKATVLTFSGPCDTECPKRRVAASGGRVHLIGSVGDMLDGD